MKAYVWLVEIRSDEGSWEAMGTCALSDAEGQRELATWRWKWPNDKFRLRMYGREEPEKRTE